MTLQDLLAALPPSDAECGVVDITELPKLGAVREALSAGMVVGELMGRGSHGPDGYRLRRTFTGRRTRAGDEAMAGMVRPPSAGLGAFRIPAWLCAGILTACRQVVGDRAAVPPYGFTIGSAEHPYLRRWFLLPRGDGPACYLHHFLRDDDDRALHDHPWASVGVMLAGGYREMLPDGERTLAVGDVTPREANFRHRVVLHRGADGAPIPAWTLFLTGDRVRDWGFWCEGDRFVPWRDFTEGDNGERVGRGCA